jgi:hypothetical protein
MNISVLLPTRGRPAGLENCLTSLINKSKDPQRIEVLLAFDRDDQDNIDYFEDVIAPWLTQAGVLFTAFKFEPLGYLRLNEYLNEMAKHSQGDWLFFWNDDASMVTLHWDQIIAEYTGKLRLLRAETNHKHPYAIFPIVPRQWVNITGNLSPHQINDAWVSQIGYMLDIVENIPVLIHHERFDLTGQNNDDTFKNRIMLENLPPGDPRDFNSTQWREIRFQEAFKLCQWIELVEQRELTHFREGCMGKRNIWSKMMDIDVYKQMMFWHE